MINIKCWKSDFSNRGFRESNFKMHRWMDIPTFDQFVEDPFGHPEDEVKTREFLRKFLRYYGRVSVDDHDELTFFKENKVEYWVQEVDRCNLDMCNPRLVYWTDKGRVTRMKITPPEFVEDNDNLILWKMIVFYDFHQKMPEITTVREFMSKNGSYLVYWYANWRKWSYKYRVWREAANKEMFDFSKEEESKDSEKGRARYLGDSWGPRMKIDVIHDWCMFDEKEEFRREEYLRGYFREEDKELVPLLMKERYRGWQSDRIRYWNNYVMDNDGNIDEEKKKLLDLGLMCYQDGAVYKDEDGLYFGAAEDRMAD